MKPTPTVAVVWRGDEAARRVGVASNERLRPVVDALGAAGIDARPVVHRDAIAAEVREELRHVDGVLVWVDPVAGDEDRRCLDDLLREASAAGSWVSAHPDVVAVLGTKEVLHRTRHLPWGSEVRRYADARELHDGLPTALADGPRVLKPRYGNGGIGVWKVELVSSDGPEPIVRVHGAEVRDTNEEQVPLAALLERCASAFEHGGCIIDQPFLPRVAEGLIRCYLVGDRVVGFARQGAGELLGEPGAPARIMGLPSSKTMLPVDDRDLARLRTLVERECVPGLLDLLELDVVDLPALWDTDFLLGPVDAEGNDAYVLCEINCSCVTPFPPEAPAQVARLTLDRLATHRRSAT